MNTRYWEFLVGYNHQTYRTLPDPKQEQKEVSPEERVKKHLDFAGRIGRE